MAKNDEEKSGHMTQDSILKAEFEYIAQATFQANEDRARVTNFYLVTLGGFIAAIFSDEIPFFESSGEHLVNITFGFLFLLVTVHGVLTLLQLARLRGAWFESVRAMNQIKNHYKNRFRSLEKAFRWTDETLPKRYKPNSVGFYLALQVALLTGVTLAVALGEFLALILPTHLLILSCLAITIIAVLLLIWVYKRVVGLQKKK